MEYPQWCKGHKSWGRNYRIQRNVYAMRVSLAMTRGARVCPCCESPMDMRNGDQSLQVDRVVPSLDYGTLGNILYVCEACNQGRALLQRVGRDWTHVKRYASDVRRASARVAVPSIPEALREWEAMRAGRQANISRYA